MVTEMNLDWKLYESITKYIYETMGKVDSVKIEGYGSSCKVPGKSGAYHQIDVLTSHSDRNRTYKTAIECKFWKKKINKDIVMKLAGIIEDADIDSGIIVSKSGFTPDGFKFAQHKNIKLIELREVNDKDLKGKTKEIPIADLDILVNVQSTRPTILSIDFGKGRSIVAKDEFDYIKFFVQTRNGKTVSFYEYVNKFRSEINLHNKVSDIITKRYEIPDSTFFNSQTKESFKIDEVIFTGQLRVSNTSNELNFTIVDHVWLIMNSIFENRTFTFSENGIIIEEINE